MIPTPDWTDLTTLDMGVLGFGALALIAALVAVSTRHVVHAALALVVSLTAVAGIYLTLRAEFVGLAQVLVYVGAVVVLIVFALMVTRSPMSPERSAPVPWPRRAAAALLGVSLAALLGYGLLPVAGKEAVEVKRSTGNGIGEAIFGAWVWPFELLSLVLLAALIAGLAIVDRSRDTGDDQ